ncbi:MAG: hypothetical protein EOO05_08690 [Chitinophagaceae bacterium]|nr:MAG: hypothetical protein EOO05_08690 [Chitinophagaceae bacterium]
MDFVKEHLKGDHYTWNEEISLSAFQGQPSRRLFNRFDGYQVLFLINSYGAAAGRIDESTGQKMESLIMHDLPLDARSEISVLNWLKEATATAF